MYGQVLNETFKAIQSTQYIDGSHHEVPAVDNGSQIHVHAYMMFTLLEKFHIATLICA